jgi:hypothetical protein
LLAGSELLPRIPLPRTPVNSGVNGFMRSGIFFGYGIRVEAWQPLGGVGAGTRSAMVAIIVAFVAVLVAVGCRPEKPPVEKPGEVVVAAGDIAVCHTEGDEATARLVAEHGQERMLVDFLMGELSSFTGEGWEQEDDITLLTLRSSAASR